MAWIAARLGPSRTIEGTIPPTMLSGGVGAEQGRLPIASPPPNIEGAPPPPSARSVRAPRARQAQAAPPTARRARRRGSLSRGLDELSFIRRTSSAPNRRAALPWGSLG